MCYHKICYFYLWQNASKFSKKVLIMWNKCFILFLGLQFLAACKPPLTNPVVDSQLQNQGGNISVPSTSRTATMTTTSTPSPTGNGGISSSITSTATATGSTSIPAALVGSWKIPCFYSQDNSSSYNSQTMTFNADGTVFYISGYYSDAKCQTATQLVKTEGTFTAGQPSTTVPGASEYMLYSTRIVITPMDAATVSKLQQMFASGPTPACNALTFTLSKETDVTACSLPTPSKAYSVFLISGNELQFGTCDGITDCSSPTARSKTLDPVKATKTQ